MIKAPRFS